MSRAEPEENGWSGRVGGRVAGGLLVAETTVKAAPMGAAPRPVAVAGRGHLTLAVGLVPFPSLRDGPPRHSRIEHEVNSPAARARRGATLGEESVAHDGFARSLKGLERPINADRRALIQRISAREEQALLERRNRALEKRVASARTVRPSPPTAPPMSERPKDRDGGAAARLRRCEGFRRTA